MSPKHNKLGIEPKMIMNDDENNGEVRFDLEGSMEAKMAFQLADRRCSCS